MMPLRLLPVVLFLLAVSPLAGQPRELWPPERLLQLKRVGDVQPSPDGKRAVFTIKQAVTAGDKSEYLTHIHIAAVDGSGTRALTSGETSCEQPRWSPDGKQVAYLSKKGGKRDLWLASPEGGEAKRLTRLDRDITSYQWSPDGKRIAYTAVDPQTDFEKQAAREKNDARVVDADIKPSRLFVIDAVPDAKPKALTPNGMSVGGVARSGYDWSPDGQRIVFAHTRTPRPNDWTTADLAVVDVSTGKITPLAAAPAAEMNPFWSPDGQHIAFMQSDNPPTWGSTGLVHVISPSGGTPRPLAETFDRGGRYTALLGWTADSKRIVFTECRGTQITLNLLPLEGPPQRLSEGPGTLGEGVLLNPARTAAGFTLEAPGQPLEAHVSPLDSFKPARLSRANLPPAEEALGRTEVIGWKAADGWAIEGLLTYPVGFEQGKKYPLLLVIHGGPMGVFTQTYLANPGVYPIASFAERGYLVLRPNPRGSSGYGHKFRYANYADWGGQDFQDILLGVDHVINLRLADPDRLGVMGWSYGGFMTSWAINQTKRFKAASVGAAVTNLVSFTGTADIPGFLPDYFKGEFWDNNLEVYRRHSPMMHVKGVSTPTLIQHGDRDDRVPLSQGEEFYNALKRQGCPVQMVVYPRQSHAIEEPRLQADAMKRNLEWFDRYLRK